MKELFNFYKTLNATAYLLNKLGSMSRIKLLKLLYIADREVLFNDGFTITGDTMHIYPNGPVLETVYYLLKGIGDNVSEWNKYIRTDDSDENIVSLINPIEIQELSRAEIKTLNKVIKEQGNKTQKELVDYTHTFEEWKKYQNKDTDYEVEPETILQLNNLYDMIPEYREHSQIQNEFNYLFGTCGN